MLLRALFKNFRPVNMANIFGTYYKHCLHCAFLLIVILTCQYILIAKEATAIDPWVEYGYTGTLFLYLSRLTTLLSLPQIFFNFCGLVFYNAFKGPVKLQGSPLTAPFICIRVVTRGDYPELVKMNVMRNFDICRNAQLKNFMIQVVTDKELGIDEQVQIKEVVVPTSYRPKSGAMFKARALQYCLDGSVGNYLSDSDWIVHLDEETLLTPNSVRGILNFVMEGRHQFGQGLITYTNGSVVNWLTTSADNFRVAEDMGKVRFQFKCFHKPLFCWKGSYVVAQVGAEKKVSFDNGPEGSVAEDGFFAIKAYQDGFSFDFIEGEMWEKSPFTIMDFIQQRKRWIQGILLVVHSKKLSFRYKIFVSLSCYAWAVMPLTTIGAILRVFYPTPWSYHLEALFVAILSVYLYLYIFGVLKTFTTNHFSVFKTVVFLFMTVLAIPINAVMENIAVIWGLLGNKLTFYIVKKDANTCITV